jgi:hypothetical protein
MQIDPVIAISEELRRAEAMVRCARACGDDELCRHLLAEISTLNDRLFKTKPTSSIGAAEILDRTSELLADRFAYCAARMHAIAERFAGGHRALADFVWLRTIVRDLDDGLYGEDGQIAAPLVASALAGASRPVLVFRSAKSPRAVHSRRSAS